MPRFLIALFVLLLPLLEIAGFVVVGSRIGALATVGLVILSALVGTVLLRVQGLGAMRRIQSEMAAGAEPGRQIVHGAMIMMAGLLLIIPGFITDIFGLLLFLPPVRDAVWSAISGRITVVGGVTGFSGARPSARPTRVIDLDERDYREIDGDAPPRRRDGAD